MTPGENASIVDAKARIDGGVDFLIRLLDDKTTRYENAAQAGANLAAAVLEVLSASSVVDADYGALRGAYTTFMSLHSGNFWTVSVGGNGGQVMPDA